MGLLCSVVKDNRGIFDFHFERTVVRSLIDGSVMYDFAGVHAFHQERQVLMHKLLTDDPSSYVANATGILMLRMRAFLLGIPSNDPAVVCMTSLLAGQTETIDDMCHRTLVQTFGDLLEQPGNSHDVLLQKIFPLISRDSGSVFSYLFIFASMKISKSMRSWIRLYRWYSGFSYFLSLHRASRKRREESL